MRPTGLIPRIGMRSLHLILFSIFLTEVSAQSSIGPWFALEQVTFFTPHVDADAGYYAEYDVPNTVAFGLCWS